MMRKRIIPNTITFVAIMIFIIMFQGVFGTENTLVGITVITAALVLLERDLTISPLSNLIKLLVGNLLLGLIAFWSSNNICLGIILNFIALFMVGYLLSYNLRKSIVVPFGLQYLFMLYAPVRGNAFFKRILGLAFGALFIMGIQFLANKDKVAKKGSKILDKIFESILLKINLLKESKDLINVNAQIEEDINILKRIIYDKRVKEFYITKDGEIVSNILCLIEKINILLDKLREENIKESQIKFLNQVYDELENIKNKNFKSSDLKAKYDCSNLNNIYVYEFTNLIESLRSEISQIVSLNAKEKNTVDDKFGIPEHFCKLAIHKRNFKIDSLRVSYGIRLGIVGVLTAFITQYFHLSEGRWMGYTIFSLIQPYSENCKMKSRQRIQGTLIGALIVFISFSIIKNTTARYLIVLLAGYLNPFAADYRELIIYVTISAVASSALLEGTTKFVLSRIMFVALGTGISLLANKYILPYKIKDGNRDLVKTYNELVKQMLIDIKDREAKNNIKNLFLIPALIEDRMKLIKFGTNCSEEKEFIYNQRVLINSICNYHLLVNKNRSIRKNITYIIDEIKLSISNNEDVISKIQNHIKNVQAPKEKLLLKNILDIIENYKKVEHKCLRNFDFV